MKKNRLFVFLAVLVAIISAVILLAPWKDLMEARLKSILVKQGLVNPQLQIASVGWRELNLSGISIGDDNPLTLNDVKLKYSLSDLWHGQIQDVELAGLNVTIREMQDDWIISGIAGGSDPKSRFSIPASVANVPLQTAKLTGGKLHIIAQDWQAEVPLDIAWQKSPEPKLAYLGERLQWNGPDIDIQAAEFMANATLIEEKGEWQGRWAIKNVQVQNKALAVPVMQAAGTFNAGEDGIKIAGTIHSADKTHQAQFQLNYSLRKPSDSILKVDSVAVPWKEGRLSSRNILIPLAGNQPIRFNLDVEGVSIDALLQAVTGKRVTGTGAVSGRVPLILGRDGSIEVNQGVLQADGAGVISMDPTAIPGDNPQIVLVQGILKNFHYSALSIAVGGGEKDKLSLRLIIEGSNPDVYNGRAVKLNLNLTGDVLDLIRQSILPLADPKRLLQQDNNANP